MFEYEPILGQVKLVGRPALGQGWQLTYPTSSGQQPSSSLSPGSSPDCSQVARYQNEMAAAAERIASSQKAMQIAVEAGDQDAIDRANISANQANKDWEVWSQAVQKCPGPPSDSTGRTKALIAAIGVGLVGLLVASGGVAEFSRNFISPKRG